MDFGIYVHIPYCIQHCHYCDFATYEQSRIEPPEEYVSWLKSEIAQRQAGVPFRELKTVYFGGGTPSLLPAPLIVSILEELGKHGFSLLSDAEVTIEINPATLTEEKIRIYKAAGINRFSVGAQSFNDKLLRSLGREHNSQETLQTLKLLEKLDCNFTFDLLFGVADQTLDHLQHDLTMVKDFGPGHVSTYCLTLKPEHPLNRNRPPEETQLEMFEMISTELGGLGYQRYEISNFSKPGFESQHNLLYWTDQPYWGLGLSAHSYLPFGEWGARFWNDSSMKLYREHVARQEGVDFDLWLDRFSDHQKEELLKHQSLTDFCHTSLRLSRGLDFQAVAAKFGDETSKLVRSRLDGLNQPSWFWRRARIKRALVKKAAW